MPEARRAWVGDLARFAGLGVQLAIWVVVLGAAGYLLDRWLTTRPWLMIVGALAGAARGMWDIVRTVSRDPELGGTRPERGGTKPDGGRRERGDDGA